ncbi:MAG: hypothetical protein ACLR2G_04665 [Phascolarctobacterium faecium]
MKKTSFLAILLAALVLAAGVVTKDSELVKVPMFGFAGAVAGNGYCGTQRNAAKSGGKNTGL